MMEAVQTFETLVNLYQSTRRYNPDETNLCKTVSAVKNLYLNFGLISITNKLLDTEILNFFT
jgi:hypothetical protein